MHVTTHGRFPKESRLRKRSDFLDVQQRGGKVAGRAFLGIFVVREGARRLGITVTRRVGNAVTRNRLKRIIREAYRLGRLALPGDMDLVVVAREAARDMTHAELDRELERLTERLRRVEGRRP